MSSRARLYGAVNVWLRLMGLRARESPLEAGWHGEGQRGDPVLYIF